jgi:hypothetical protein
MQKAIEAYLIQLFSNSDKFFEMRYFFINQARPAKIAARRYQALSVEGG